MSTISTIDFSPEWEFKATRSSGPGGQAVNKLNTRVTLRWNLQNSQLITDDQKKVLLKKLTMRLTSKMELLIDAQEYRTQSRNKQAAIDKFYTLLEDMLKKPKTRRPSKPGKGAIEKRLKAKKIRAEKKKFRGDRFN